jgi:hypothetical protein
MLDFKKFKGGDKTVAAAIQTAINDQASGNHQSAANLYNNLSEMGTEAGRTSQAFSLLKKMSPESISLSAAGLIKKYNATHNVKIPELNGDRVKMISDKVKLLDNIPEGRQRNIALKDIQQTINAFIPSSFADKFIATWKAGLLSSLRTHERNLIGNTIMSSAEVAKDPIAAVVDRLLSLRTGQRSTSFTLRGGLSGAKEGIQSAADMVRYGFDPEETINKFDFKKLNWGKNPVEQVLKKYTDAIFNTLGAEDKVFYKSAYLRSMFDQAITQAKNTGKVADKKFINNMVSNPSEKMITNAIAEANYATFKDTTMLGKAINSFKNSIGDKQWAKIPAEIIAPFTGVPTSIAGKLVDYSPIGLVKGLYNAGKVAVQNIPDLQRQASQEVARGLMGTGLFGLGAYLYDKGLISGQPKDANEANLWQAQGKQANSIFIGGKWRSINSVGPQSLVTLAGAKYAEEMKKQDGSIGAFAGGVGKDFLNQTFLAGVQAPLQAITEPQRYGTSYVGNQLSTAIPNISKDAARAFDAKARETATVTDYLKFGIPGLRNTLTEKRDILGNVVPQEPTGINAFFDVFNSKTPKDNVVLSELVRLNDAGNPATPSKLTANQTILKQKIKLTVEQLNQLEAGSGELVKQSLNSLISSPSYQALTDDQKAQAISNAVQQARSVYKAKNGSKFLNDPNLKVKTPSSTTEIKTTTSAKFDKPFVLTNDSGSVRIIDLSSPLNKPALTGDKLLDKKLTSQYNSSVETRKTDIVNLFKDGQINKEDAVKMLKELDNTKIINAKKKRVTFKKLKTSAPPKIKVGTYKSKKFKLQSAKISKAKLPTIKAPKAPKV